MPRPRVMWTLEEACEWFETKRPPAPVVPHVEFDAVDIYNDNKRAVVDGLAERGVHADERGQFWREDVQRIFPPRGRGRPPNRRVGLPSDVVDKSKEVAPGRRLSLPSDGRIRALAIHILTRSKPLTEYAIASDFATIICRKRLPKHPEKSNGFKQAYHLALELASAEVLIDGWTLADQRAVVSEWRKFRLYRSNPIPD